MARTIGRHASGRPKFEQPTRFDPEDTVETDASADEISAAASAIIAEITGEDPNNDEPDSFVDEDFWQETVFDQIHNDIDAIADKYDMDLNYLEGWFGGQKDNLVNHIDTLLQLPSGYADHPTSRPINVDPTTPEGMQEIIYEARKWVGTRWPAFNEALSGSISSGGGGGGRRGRRRPTAAEIRSQFDVEQLTNTINQMSQALLLEEAPEARSMAKAYVSAIVANPDQKLDFETFVREKLLAKPRAKMIYQNKPEGLSEEQFLQPYVQAAQQRIGPGFGDQLSDIAIGGARMVSSPQTFQARLNRTRQVQSGAPFLSKLGQRLSSVREVLR